MRIESAANCAHRDDRKCRLCLKLSEMKRERRAQRPRSTRPRRSGKLIRGVVTNSRIYLSLWKVFPGKCFQGGLRDRPSKEQCGTARNRAPSSAGIYDSLRVATFCELASARKFPQRSYLCVAIKEPLKRGGFNSRPIPSPPLSIRSV